MHFLPTLAAFLHLLPALTCAFEWESPDTNSKLNLSAPSIVIAWDPNAGSGTEYQQVDIWFRAESASGTLFGWELQVNITVADGNYTWDPREIHDIIISDSNTLSADKTHYFEAELHDANSTGGANLESDKYEVDGYDGLVSGGVGVQNLLDTRSFSVTATGAFIVAIAWCL
ncbi:hypothetical protein SLS62_005069 [Diatrype stigma]|uniref:Uncharacterized protein n=1 Tax=Diatrype stigma TaxID=117547 RepID=A0AAN9UQ55_9PEZI